MTEARVSEIIYLSVRRALDAGFDLKQAIDAGVAKMYLAVEMEIDAQGQGVVDAVVPTPKSDPLPSPPPSAEGASSVLILPGDQRFNEPIPARSEPADPALSGRFRVGGEASAPRDYWEQDDLRDVLERTAPAYIEFVPRGKTKSIRLDRNLTVLHGLGLVKLEYLPSEVKHPTASFLNPNGEPLQAMAIDCPVGRIFSCQERDLQLVDRMREILEVAAVAYGPRPESIASHTPRRLGALSYGPSDPHESVEPILNPLTGVSY